MIAISFEDVPLFCYPIPITLFYLQQQPDISNMLLYSSANPSNLIHHLAYFLYLSSQALLLNCINRGDKLY